MKKFILTVAISGLGPPLFVAALSAVEREAVIRKVDAGKGTVILSLGDQERTVGVARDVKVLDATGKELAGGVKTKGLEGAEVTVTVEPEDGRPVIKAIRLGKQAGSKKQPAKQAGKFRPAKFGKVDPAKLKIPADGKLPVPGIGVF